MHDNQREWAERLILILNTLNLKNKKVATAMSSNPTFISQVRNKHRSVTAEFIYRFCEAYPQINLEWFLNGKGTMMKGSEVVADQVLLPEIYLLDNGVDVESAMRHFRHHDLAIFQRYVKRLGVVNEKIKSLPASVPGFQPK